MTAGRATQVGSLWASPLVVSFHSACGVHPCLPALLACRSPATSLPAPPACLKVLHPPLLTKSSTKQPAVCPGSVSSEGSLSLDEHEALMAAAEEDLVVRRAGQGCADAQLCEGPPWLCKCPE